MLNENCEWTATRKVLEDLKEKCICFVCKNIARSPHEYECGHFFCELCIDWSRNACPVCGVPSHASVIVPDRCITSCIEVLNTFNSLLNLESSSSTKGLLKNPDVQTTHTVDSADLPQETGHSKSTERSSVKANSRKSVTKNSGSHKREDNIEKKREPNDFTMAQKSEEEERAENKNGQKRPVSKRPRSRKKSRSTSVTKLDEIQNSPNTNTEKSKPKRTIHSPKAATTKDKRNAKGETPLQVACIKGDAARVKILLDEGANPNTKDFAGWTPLHEAVQSGNFTIAELLVKAGAVVNATGAGNTTALHEAVESNNIDIVKLLVSHGASVNARNAHGLSPRDIARSDEIKLALSDNVNSEIIRVDEDTSCFDIQRCVILPCELSEKQEKDFQKFVKSFRFHVLDKYSSEVDTILTNTEGGQIRTLSLPLLCGILQGKWILSFDWVNKCMAENNIVDHRPFETKGTSNFPDSGAPRKGRMTSLQQLPSIFNGCYIYLMHGGVYTVHGLNLNKKDLTSLIQMGGGTILYREPNPESIPESESNVPFHASSEGPLAKCSHYIIYRPGKTEPQLKYNMSHVKSLPIDWLISCIEKFELNL